MNKGHPTVIQIVTRGTRRLKVRGTFWHGPTQRLRPGEPMGWIELTLAVD